MEIDQIDRRILRQLQSNSDVSLDVLGEAVGLSRNACWRRVKLMTDAGIIKGRVTLLDAEAIGLPLTVFIQVRTDRHTAEWSEKFARASRALPQIQGVYRMSGELDYLIRARVSDMKDYDRLYQKLTASVPLADVSASFVMEEIKETTALPV
ncbi:MAG: Lrp/AsnC family transcriptional regulator [Planktotalea sp.]|uniref:Lrp/AsnC family transcriptional regulator n=1 Tax=Planktotalea sp. TaxID=2029877 RepID=UPI003C70FC05